MSKPKEQAPVWATLTGFNLTKDDPQRPSSSGLNGDQTEDLTPEAVFDADGATYE